MNKLKRGWSLRTVFAMIPALLVATLVGLAMVVSVTATSVTIFDVSLTLGYVVGSCFSLLGIPAGFSTFEVITLLFEITHRTSFRQRE